MLTTKPKVLFIAAHSRSGSTILDRLLAQVDGAFTTGELRYIWQRSFIENQLCGCNSKFNECSVWNEIIEKSCLDIELANRLNNISRDVDRFIQIPRILNPSLRSSSFDNKLSEYVSGIGRVYNSIQEVIKPEFIIDSSKSPSYAMLLSLIPEIDLHYIHLVRDSRAVAYSRMNAKKRPEIHWKEEYTAVTPPYKSALQWNIINYTLGLLDRKHSYSLVKYEDFIRNPEQTISNIVRDIGVSNKNISFIQGSNANLKTDHTLSGNPMRFTVGDIELRQDERWKEGLHKKNKFIIESLSRYMLKKYGYL